MENQQHQAEKHHQDKNTESKSNEFTKTNAFGQGLNGEDPNANAEEERKDRKSADNPQKTLFMSKIKMIKRKKMVQKTKVILQKVNKIKNNDSALAIPASGAMPDLMWISDINTINAFGSIESPVANMLDWIIFFL